MALRQGSPEVIQLLQDEIDKLENEAEAELTPDEENMGDLDTGFDDSYGGGSSGFSTSEPMDFSSSTEDDLGFGEPVEEPAEDTGEENDTLPSPDDLGVGDLTDLTNPEL